MIFDKPIKGIGHTAEDLFNAAIKYFSWCDQNPIYKKEVVKSGEHAGKIFNVPIDRPYTLRGLCLHMGITIEYLYEVSKSKEQNDFYFVVKSILDIVHTQVLEGTLTGIYQPAVGSKHLRLGEADSHGGVPVVNVNVINNSPKLLNSEGEIEIPEDRR